MAITITNRKEAKIHTTDVFYISERCISSGVVVVVPARKMVPNRFDFLVPLVGENASALVPADKTDLACSRQTGWKRLLRQSN
jgi:hypothetical protein